MVTCYERVLPTVIWVTFSSLPAKISGRLPWPALYTRIVGGMGGWDYYYRAGVGQEQLCLTLIVYCTLCLLVEPSDSDISGYSPQYLHLLRNAVIINGCV